MLYRSYAKINVFLDVIKRYKTGYHALNSIFLEIDFHDSIQYKQIQTKKCEVIEKTGTINPEQNLLLDAYHAFFHYIKRSPIGIQFDLEKRIPTGGGLGGGSSNAAAVLKILRQITQTPISDKKLEKLACTLGSDVPYFIKGKTQKVRGQGQFLSSLPVKKMDLKILLLLPEVRIATVDAYRWLEEDHLVTLSYQNQKKYRTMQNALITGDYPLFIHSLYNKFEEAVFKRNKELEAIKNKMLNSGLDNALMSGSGSSFLGFSDSNEKLGKSIEILTEKGYKVREIKVKY